MLGNEPIESSAVFSDETANFRTPEEACAGDIVTIRIRTARNDVDQIEVVSDAWKKDAVKSFSDEYFDYYTTSFLLPQEPISYYFSIKKGEAYFYYDKTGLKNAREIEAPFLIIPGFQTPDWMKGTAMYQIYVDRFYNGDSGNDVVAGEYSYLGKPVSTAAHWYDLPPEDDYRNFYGGDLKGVIEKLDYLKELGVEGIYLNPLFVSPSSHKYDVQDYDYIDPHFGVILEDDKATGSHKAVSYTHLDVYKRQK